MLHQAQIPLSPAERAAQAIDLILSGRRSPNVRAKRAMIGRRSTLLPVMPQGRWTPERSYTTRSAASQTPQIGPAKATQPGRRGRPRHRHAEMRGLPHTPSAASIARRAPFEHLRAATAMPTRSPRTSLPAWARPRKERTRPARKAVRRDVVDCGELFDSSKRRRSRNNKLSPAGFAKPFFKRLPSVRRTRGGSNSAGSRPSQSCLCSGDGWCVGSSVVAHGSSPKG